MCEQRTISPRKVNHREEHETSASRLAHRGCILSALFVSPCEMQSACGVAESRECNAHRLRDVCICMVYKARILSREASRRICVGRFTRVEGDLEAEIRQDKKTRLKRYIQEIRIK